MPMVVDDVTSISWRAEACNPPILSVCEPLLIDCLYDRNDGTQQMRCKCVWVRIQVRGWNIPRQSPVAMLEDWRA